MFGYVMAAPELLNENDNMRWHGWYCGLCRALGKRCGQHCRMLLTFDMTFLAVLLSSVYQLPELNEENTCFLHPLKKHTEIFTEASGYAADMNVLLAYHKLLDDWQDDKNIAALFASSIFKGNCTDIRKKYPRQAIAVNKCLHELGEFEKNDELDPDLTANCFGKLMGELFVMNDGDCHSEHLRRFGQALGRFVYTVDAAADLRSDLKHERYNPLVNYPSEYIDEILQILGGEIMNSYKSLKITCDREIIENVLAAGIWLKYRIGKKNNLSKKDEDTNG